MRKLFSSIGSLVILGLVFIIITLINLLVHEFGHCLTTNAVGGKCEGVYVMPGYKFWPLGGFGDRYPEPDKWNDAIGQSYNEIAPPTRAGIGLMLFMGSGSTALLSVLGLSLLWIFKPGGWARNLLMMQSLFFADLLLYVILPEWFDLQHFFFVGGRTPEPLIGAEMLGFEHGDVIIGVLIFSGVMFIGWLSYARRLWKTSRK